MLFKKENGINMQGTKVDFHVSSDSTISGDVQTKSSISVDGHIRGGIIASGNVYLGKDAVVDGDISGSDIHIAGVVNGGISAAGELTLVSSAKVSGSIKAAGVRIEKETKYEGVISMGMDGPKEFIKPVKQETLLADSKLS